MNIIESLETLLKTKKKSLSESQTIHLNAAIAYLKNLPKDFNSAKKEYFETIKKLQNQKEFE